MRARQPMYSKVCTDVSLGIDIYKSKFRGENYYFEVKKSEKPKSWSRYTHWPDKVRFVDKSVAEDKRKLKSYLALRKLAR